MKFVQEKIQEKLRSCLIFIHINFFIYTLKPQKIERILNKIIEVYINLSKLKY